MVNNKSLNLSTLFYQYPAELVATEPKRPSRVMWVENGEPQELIFSDFLNQFKSGDVLVLNDTQVLKRRVFSGDLEILFLNSDESQMEWEVLFPSKKLHLGSKINLPGEFTAELIKKGRPQKIRTDRPLSESYFLDFAELPLPPYIQKARVERHNVSEDKSWYQTAWAEKPGSLAAPTASLHFSGQDLETLAERGVIIKKLTLHVGLGTFLPLTEEAILSKTLHKEVVQIPLATWDEIQKARAQGRRIWALGTTVTRSLESCARGMLPQVQSGYLGETDLFIQPGDEYLCVDGLLTNFHQPESSLLALVQAFSGAETTRMCYEWAINKRFRLFSYGDLSAWIKPLKPI
ncbi:MAG: tRNA preQ1(34) S-adenosylmethionine ribosyltransferase-isomerase QueA [Bdellovibrionales bacterium]